MNYLSLCAILKNEARYMQEWLSFYVKQGVEHFYFYDNESTDGTKDACREFADKITWHDLKGIRQQRVAYNHTVTEYRQKTKWCCFFDADEFCYHRDYESFNIPLRYYEDYGGLAVHWLIFGSSGEKEYISQPVTKRFTRRAAQANQHVKSIMQMEHTLCMGNDPHTFRSVWPIVDENYRILPQDYALDSMGTTERWRMNHYHNKSLEEYLERRKLPDANTGEYKDPMEQFLAHDSNDVEDREIWQKL